MFNFKEETVKKVSLAAASTWPLARSTLAAQTMAITDVTKRSSVVQVYEPQCPLDTAYHFHSRTQKLTCLL